MRYIWGTYLENFIDYTIGWNRKKKTKQNCSHQKKNKWNTQWEWWDICFRDRKMGKKNSVFFYLLESFFRNKYTVSLPMYVCVFVRVSSLLLRIENKTTTIITKNEIQKKNVQPKRLGHTFHPSIRLVS